MQKTNTYSASKMTFPDDIWMILLIVSGHIPLEVLWRSPHADLCLRNRHVVILSSLKLRRKETLSIFVSLISVLNISSPPFGLRRTNNATDFPSGRSLDGEAVRVLSQIRFLNKIVSLLSIFSVLPVAVGRVMAAGGLLLQLLHCTQLLTGSWLPGSLWLSGSAWLSQPVAAAR